MGDGDGVVFLKDASRARSGAGEGEIVRRAAFLSAEVMAERWRYLSCAATRPPPSQTSLGINERGAGPPGRNTAGPRTRVICQAAVLLRQGETRWRRRGERRGGPADRGGGGRGGRPPPGNTRVALLNAHRQRATISPTRFNRTNFTARNQVWFYYHHPFVEINMKAITR